MSRMTLRLDESVRRYVDQVAEAEGVPAATWAADVVRKAALSAISTMPEPPNEDLEEWRQLVRRRKAARRARLDQEG
jgi:hypothetical protein